MSLVSLQPRAGGLVLWALLLDLAVLASWQTLDPLRWSVLQHGSQVPSDRLTRALLSAQQEAKMHNGPLLPPLSC